MYFSVRETVTEHMKMSGLGIGFSLFSIIRTSIGRIMH